MNINIDHNMHKVSDHHSSPRMGGGYITAPVTMKLATAWDKLISVANAKIEQRSQKIRIHDKGQGFFKATMISLFLFFIDE